MSTIKTIPRYTAAEAAQITGLFSESELKRMCARNEIQHHRGGRRKILFFQEDIDALLKQFRRTPVKKSQPTATEVLTPETPSPFRTTPRSKAAHKESDRRAA